MAHTWAICSLRTRSLAAETGLARPTPRVLPIGGLKEKVLAAHRAGIKRVIVPERNRGDLDEVPDEVKRELEFVYVSRMDQVIEAALEEPVDLRARPASPPASLAQA